MLLSQLIESLAQDLGEAFQKPKDKAKALHKAEAGKKRAEAKVAAMGAVAKTNDKTGVSIIKGLSAYGNREQGITSAARGDRVARAKLRAK